MGRDSNVKVSVIVPVRNGEQYLRDCTRFLDNQTFKDFESIFIIDGSSTDNSIDLASELLRNKQSSKIIIQNQGLKQGGNRNIGLDIAVGEAIWFLDVDDAPSPFFLEVMYDLLSSTDSDFVSCNFVNEGPKGIVKEGSGTEYHSKILVGEEGVISCSREEIPVTVWSKLFRRDFLLRNGISFEDSYSEDILFVYRCLSKCERIAITDRPLYAYRQTGNSVCRNKDNIDLRGRCEIEAYDTVDQLFSLDEVRRHNAVLKMRSSGHMTRRAFVEYAKSPKNLESYNRYLKGTLEGWYHVHLPNLYWISIRLYIVLVYKRNGSTGIKKRLS